MGKHAKNRKSDGGSSTIIWIIIILVVVLVLGYMTKDSIKGAVNSGKTNEVVAEANKDEKRDEQVKKQETAENKQETKNDETKENTSKTEETKQETNQNQATSEETSESDEDKAIELAKKQYGTTDGVYFKIEQIQSDNLYVISVRDSESTRDLYWYVVDVKNGTVKDF